MIRLIVFTALAILSSIGAWGCQRSEDFPNGSLSEWIPLGWDWKGAKEHILSPEEWQAEISEKMDRLQAFLKEEGLRGVLLTRVRYVQWITAGLANTEIAQGRENGAGSLLIMDDVLVMFHSSINHFHFFNRKGYTEIHTITCSDHLSNLSFFLHHSLSHDMIRELQVFVVFV